MLYEHYETLERDWGPTPLEDQAMAGGIMWAGGDAAFVLALVLTVAAWLRHEEREAVREDARLARARVGRDEAPTKAGAPQVAPVLPAAPVTEVADRSAPAKSAD